MADCLGAPGCRCKWHRFFDLTNVKHATPETIARLGSLLSEIRKVPGLTEKSPGTFYQRSSAFLHFHEDPAGIFVDIKLDTEWLRLPVNSARDRSALLRTIRNHKAKSSSA